MIVNSWRRQPDERELPAHSDGPLSSSAVFRSTGRDGDVHAVAPRGCRRSAATTLNRSRSAWRSRTETTADGSFAAIACRAVCFASRPVDFASLETGSNPQLPDEHLMFLSASARQSHWASRNANIPARRPVSPLARHGLSEAEWLDRAEDRRTIRRP